MKNLLNKRTAAICEGIVEERKKNVLWWKTFSFTSNKHKEIFPFTPCFIVLCGMNRKEYKEELILSTKFKINFT